MNWVTLQKAIDESGISKNAFYKYIQRGELREKIHWVKKRGRYYINKVELEKWILTS